MTTPPSTESPPSKVRYGVLGTLCLLSFILYLDRVCISQALTDIQADLKLSHGDMSYVLGAFTLAYGLFEVPIGHWGDRYGSRGVLARIAIWWSAFTMLTGVCNALTMLIVVRFLFGAGEAGALPNAARVIARWFPPQGRGPAQGMIMTSALIGGALSPMLAQALIDLPALGWRGAFAVLGLPGLVWAAAFYYWFRDDPAEHPAVNESERQLLAASQHAATENPQVPWSITLRQANLWLLGGIIACCSFTTYLFFSWYPTYLKQGRGIDADTTSGFAGLVLAAGAVGSLSGGFLSDRLLRQTGTRRVRCFIGVVCLTIAGVSMGSSQFLDQPAAAVGCAALACFLIHVQLAAWWGVVADLSGRHLGALFGLMNSMGLLGAITSQVFLGHFVDWLDKFGYVGRAQWDPAFYIYGGLLLLGAVGWLIVNPHRSLIAADHKPA